MAFPSGFAHMSRRRTRTAGSGRPGGRGRGTGSPGGGGAPRPRGSHHVPSPLRTQIITIPTTNSSSKTSRTQTRYLSTRPATSARCRRPRGRPALRFSATLSRRLWAAVPSRTGPRPRGGRRTRRLPFPRRSAGARPPRRRTAPAAGRPMSATRPSTTTSPRTTCRPPARARTAPSRPSLPSCPFSKEVPRPLSSSWLTSPLPNRRGTQKSRRLSRRRRTNTVSVCAAAVGKQAL